MPSSDDSLNFSLIEQMIEIIDKKPRKTIKLEEIATQMNLDTRDLQNMFSKWIGVVPKKYQEYLTKNYSTILSKNRFVHFQKENYQMSLQSNRLGALFSNLFVMSPKKLKEKGEQITIYWGWFDSMFGDSLVMGTDEGICGIGFVDCFDRARTFEDMKQRWPSAFFKKEPNLLSGWVKSAFASKQNLKLCLIGDSFQIKVWKTLINIPYGYVTNYSEIATAIGHPKAQRAVGTAVGRNPISWIIPCHRVLQKSGGLGGFHWGLKIKRSMLAYESGRHESGINL